MDKKKMSIPTESKQIANDGSKPTGQLQKLTTSECILLLQSKQHSLEREMDKLKGSIESVQRQMKEITETMLKDIKFQNDCLMKKIDNFVTTESIERHPLKRYKDLPILKLHVGMNYAR